jgi:hypothetical protein
MKLYGKARRRARYRHWEMWAAAAVFVASVGLGGYLGRAYFAHPLPVVILGAIVGSVVAHRTERYVDRRYGRKRCHGQ